MTEAPGLDLPALVQADLKAALRGRDQAGIRALRTLLSALANAEAPAFDPSSHREGRGELVEHERVVLTAADHLRVLDTEIAGREQLLDETRGTGVPSSYTADLEEELAVLRRYRA